MVDLDCNLSRSVPEFFLLLLLRGAKWDECEERRWMESACAQRASVLSVVLALLASNPSIHPPTRASMRRPSFFFFHRQDGAEATGPSRGHSRTGLLLDPSRSQGTGRLDGGRGSSVRLRVL